MKLISIILLGSSLAFHSVASVAVINGSSKVCVGASVNLNDSTGGGEWSCSNTAIATISSSGTVNGVSSGTVIITYSVGANFQTKAIVVNPLPSPIFGRNIICQFGIDNSARHNRGGRHVVIGISQWRLVAGRFRI